MGRLSAPAKEKQEYKPRTAAERDRAELERREAAYREGFRARQAGKGRDASPYTEARRVAETQLERAAWAIGWGVADGTAEAEGEERLAAVPLVAGRKPNAVAPHKVKDQISAFDLDEYSTKPKAGHKDALRDG